MLGFREMDEMFVALVLGLTLCWSAIYISLWVGDAVVAAGWAQWEHMYRLFWGGGYIFATTELTKPHLLHSS